MSELWEIVRADELQVGDVIRQSVKDPICEIEWMTRGRSSVLLNDCRGHLAKEFVFRRVPDTDDPRLLRQVIENLAFDPKWEVRDEIEFMADQIKHWIDQARRELESEGREAEKGGAE